MLESFMLFVDTIAHPHEEEPSAPSILDSLDRASINDGCSVSVTENHITVRFGCKNNGSFSSTTRKS